MNMTHTLLQKPRPVGRQLAGSPVSATKNAPATIASRAASRAKSGIDRYIIGTMVSFWRAHHRVMGQRPTGIGSIKMAPKTQRANDLEGRGAITRYFEWNVRIRERNKVAEWAIFFQQGAAVRRRLLAVAVSAIVCSAVQTVHQFNIFKRQNHGIVVFWSVRNVFWRTGRRRTWRIRACTSCDLPLLESSVII